MNTVANPLSNTGLVYDVRMRFHAPGDPRDKHPEDPQRIWRIYDALQRSQCLDKCVRIKTREATTEDILLVHDLTYHDTISRTAQASQLQLDKLASQYDSIYLCPESAYVARLACGSLIELCKAVVQGQVSNGFAAIRPPGHHAERIEAMGFCLYNNVAVATRWVQRHCQIKRVLIVDWDVHHGNGIQEAFYQDPDVLYFSLHRYEGGTFYPCSPVASCDSIGMGPGVGRNVNVGWPCAGMGDGDYLHAFDQLLMPMAREFDPELVIVACGFDAAKGDTLGECFVTPAGYAHMTNLLKSLAGGRLVLALEGGYSLDAVADCALACVQVLLGENMDILDKNSTPDAPRSTPHDALGTSLPRLGSLIPSRACLETISQVKQAHTNHWQFLQGNAVTMAERQENNLPIFNLHDVVSSFRWDQLQRKLNMVEMNASHLLYELALPITPGWLHHSVHTSVQWQRASCLVIFVHDSPEVRYQAMAERCNLADTTGSFLTDVTLFQLEHFVQRGYGIIDISIPSSYLQQDATLVPQTFQTLLLALWDNMVGPSDVKWIIFLGMGDTACTAITQLIDQRPVESRVTGYMGIPSTLSPSGSHITEQAVVPQVSKRKAAWYHNISVIGLHPEHPLVKGGNKRYQAFGLCYPLSVAAKDFYVVVHVHRDLINQFIDNRFSNSAQIAL
ncbi:Histone deacetylase hda1 [Dispira parvispora]|uniref:histone deacetylase n=1 Tax=Dispira parvispora TaxID=1520584 RepID=A0A9W8B0Y0_9FUNG|nr:Histone deacetylase hda1 [Dispira parvispora]